MDTVARSAAGQAMPAAVHHVGPEAFASNDHTEVRWLGNASILLNVRGTTVMIDPLLVGFDMESLIEMPILPEEVPHVDALLYTHIDNDHFSRPTMDGLFGKVGEYHATRFVAEVMGGSDLEHFPLEHPVEAQGHDIGETFRVGPARVTLTPTWHNWQNLVPKWHFRDWERRDYCGYWIETPDGTIWLPSDSRPLPELLEMEKTMGTSPDVILFDFADNRLHLTFDGAVELANTYPEADLVCIHWGCVDAPDFNTFNGDPEKIAAAVKNPERVHALIPGDPFVL